MESKKQLSKISIFEMPGVKSCKSRLCSNPLGAPPSLPHAQYQNMVRKRKYGLKHALRSVDGHIVCHTMVTIS